MAKKFQEETVTDLPTGNSPIEPKFTRFMVGTYLDPVTREWMLAYTKFDPVTKTVDVLQTERVAGNHEVMVERFQIKVGNLGLMIAEDIVEEKKIDLY